MPECQVTGPASTPAWAAHTTSGRTSRKPGLQLRFKIMTNIFSVRLPLNRPSLTMFAQVCLTSNLTCNSVPSAVEHQAGLYHTAGLPIILCTDDKGVFSCSLSGHLI